MKIILFFVLSGLSLAADKFDFSSKSDDETSKTFLEDVVAASLNIITLEAKVDSLTDETDFLRRLFEQETATHPAAILGIFDKKSGAEAESVYKAKIKELQASSDQQAEALLTSKKGISDLSRAIQRLQAEIENVKTRRMSLSLFEQRSFGQAEDRGAIVRRDAPANLAELEAAQQNNIQEMGQQLKSYKQLWRAKLATDLKMIVYDNLL